jgi:soluble lytic murein transglycosylase-like protein
MLGAVVLSPETLEPIINEMGAKYNVEPALIKAHIKAESNWDVNASRYEAHKADASWGLMQLLLVTARGVLGDPNLSITQLIQPRVNIEAGTKFILSNLNRFGNMRDAIAAYNAGSPRLGTDGKYVNQAYVDKVTNNYNLYKTMGTGVVTEAAIDTTEAVTDVMSSDYTPYYILAGLGVVGLILMANKSEV